MDMAAVNVLAAVKPVRSRHICTCGESLALWGVAFSCRGGKISAVPGVRRLTVPGWRGAVSLVRIRNG